MEQGVRQVSALTRAIRKAIVALFAFGLLLAVALVLCFGADLLGLWREAVGSAFPTIAVLIVYCAVAMLLLRLALALSLRRDRAS